MTETALAGIGVLVTRPRHQAGDLVDAIEAHGGEAIQFPAIEITPRPAAEILEDATNAKDPAITIFVSPNAVRYGLDYTGSGTIAAIGPATAAAIGSAGRTVDIVSASGYDSEHLLGEPALKNVEGKTVRIIRGNKGRELLADTLKSRGANVDFLPVYTRSAPVYSAAELDRLEADWRAGRIDVVTIMSTETLINLLAVLPESCQDLLSRTPLVTPAARVIKEALDRLPGIPTALALGPQSSDIILAIMELRLNAPGKP